MELIYGEAANPKDSKYRMLKSRMKSIMLNSLLVEDTLTWKYSTYDEAYVFGCQQQHLSRSSIIKRAYNAAGEVALRAFERLRKFEIVVVNEGLTAVLSDLYLSVNRDPARFEKYQNLNDEYLSNCSILVA